MGLVKVKNERKSREGRLQGQERIGLRKMKEKWEYGGEKDMEKGDRKGELRGEDGGRLKRT